MVEQALPSFLKQKGSLGHGKVSVCPGGMEHVWKSYCSPVLKEAKGNILCPNILSPQILE